MWYVCDGHVFYVQLLEHHKSDSSADLMEKLDECLADGTCYVHCMLK